MNSDTGNVIQETTGLLKSLNNLTKGDKQRLIRANKLQNEFQSGATRFAEIQKVCLNQFIVLKESLNSILNSKACNCSKKTKHFLYYLQFL